MNPADPLAAVLRRARVEAAFFSRAVGRRPWGVETRGATVGIFHVVVRGGAALAALDRVHPLAPGDVVLLPHGHPHVLADPPGAPAVWIGALPSVPGPLPTVHAGQGEPDTEILCGTLRFAPPARELLLLHLPPVLVGHGGPGLAPFVARLAAELAEHPLGAEAVAAAIGELLFVLALREWVASGEAGPSWLAGLADPALARAMGLVQAAPGHDWSAEELARRVGLSRTVFYERFTRATGQTPLAWVTAWRMLVAREALAEGRQGMAEVAAAVGYANEAAFHRAFKRVVGLPPARWRREQRG